MTSKRYDNIRFWAAWITPFVALGFLVYALVWQRSKSPGLGTFNAVIVALWTLGTPVYFWWEWYHFPKEKLGTNDWESFTHGHEVSRNIWIAYIVILAALLDVSWLG